MKHIKCGRVLFTVSAEFYDSSRVPTQTGVALQIGSIAVATVAVGMVVGVGLVGGLNGVMSVKSTKIDGLYADGKTVVVGGRRAPDSHAYELFMEC